LEQREPFQWTEQKAFWYLRAVEYNDYPVALLKVILPLLKGCKSVVDVGAGCGAFALALARVLPTVTALEPSPAMAGLLRQRALSMGLSNIELIEAPFQEAEVAPHDAVLCAFLQEAHEELESFLSWDKLFLGELSRLVGGKEHPKRSDYLETVVKLHERGIFTNVSMVEFNLDQPFDDLDEALQFWREYLKLEDDHHDEALREFLGGRLVGVEGGPVASVPHLSAVLWWDLP
jgi:precorrin-6B methylase 2